MNLVPNPGFEDDVSGWDVTGGTLTRTADASLAHSGTGAGVMEASPDGVYASPGGDVGGLRCGMEPGHTYRFSVWAFVPSASGLDPGHMILTFVDNDGTGYRHTQSASVTATDVWQRLTVTGTVRPGATEAFVRVWYVGAGTGTVLIDDAELVDPASVESTLAGIVEAFATALQPIRGEIEDLQIYPYLNTNPTPPSIDVYPGDPFQGGNGFGHGADLFFTVRARVTTADPEGGSKLLFQLLEPDGPASVEAALCADQTLGGTVDSLAIGEAAGSPGVSGFREYLQDSATNGRLLGCEWRVRVLT